MTCPAFTLHTGHLDCPYPRITFAFASALWSRSKQVLAALAQRGVLASSMGGPTLRLVTHLDVKEDDIQRACEALVAAGAGAAAGGE